MNDDIRYQLALKYLDGVGPTRAKNLVAYCGGVKAVFEANKPKLLTVPGISESVVLGLDRDAALRRADQELPRLEKAGLRMIFYTDSDYPRRLRHCDDGPVLLFAKGKMNLNKAKVVSVVGTRMATDYGKQFIEKLMEGLRRHDVLVVSGLALGIDTAAHRTALAVGLETVGVLGNGPDTIYPALNRSLADKMMNQGGILSEFDLGAKPDRENFPQRNRVVAGMCDVCVVVETAVKGGSMITARLAADYNRDVMALPGSIHAEFSSGCNHLIKNNQAHMIESAEDLERLMGWSVEMPAATQRQLFVDLNEDERQILNLMTHGQRHSLDNLSLESGFPVSKTSTVLLELEFKGVVRAMPGKVFATI